MNLQFNKVMLRMSLTPNEFTVQQSHVMNEFAFTLSNIEKRFNKLTSSTFTVKQSHIMNKFTSWLGYNIAKSYYE